METIPARVRAARALWLASLLAEAHKRDVQLTKAICYEATAHVRRMVTTVGVDTVMAIQCNEADCPGLVMLLIRPVSKTCLDLPGRECYCPEGLLCHGMRTHSNLGCYETFLMRSVDSCTYVYSTYVCGLSPRFGTGQSLLASANVAVAVCSEGGGSAATYNLLIMMF